MKNILTYLLNPLYILPNYFKKGIWLEKRMETVKELREYLMLTRPYQDELLKALTDPEEAAAYLNAAIDEGSEELFLLALRNVGEAQNLKKEGMDISLSDLAHILSRIGLRFSLKTG